MLQDSMDEDAVIAAMYRAATGETPWREALNAINSVTGCWVSQLMGVDLATGRITYSYEGGDGYPEAIVEYVRHYHQIDPHLQYLIPLEPGHWYHSTDHYDDAAAAVHPFYQDFLIPFGDRYVSAAKIDQDETSAVILGLHRAVGTSPLDAAMRLRVERLGLHLRHAVSIWQKQRRVLAEAALGRELLNRMGSAVMLIDEERRIGVANDLARDMLGVSNAGAMRDERGRLLLGDSAADQALTLALRKLALSGRMGLDASQRLDRVVIQVPTSNQLPVAMCLLALRPESTMGAFGQRPLAMVILHDPNLRSGLDPFMVASAYDLTPAEARVAVAMATGKVPKQIAQDHGVAVPTVRTQVRALYGKLRVSSDSELVAMLNSAPFAMLR
jgi:DNA-binding CsgD family transcriptional regulator/PAS domain-containing protein